MIIFGTKGITSIQKKGTFHCPACGAGAPYDQKEVRRYFTLFFIPVIPLHKVADYVECGRCGGNFKPEVLSWNGVVPDSPPSSTPPPLGPVAAASIRPGTPPALPGMNPGSATTVSYQANGLAKGSMILGIVGMLTSFLICPSVLFLVPSLVMGIIGLNRAKNGNGLVGGKTAAITGITCSAIGLVAMMVFPWLLLDKDHSPGKKSPKYAAASKVSGASTETAYGNTPKARELAEQYAAAMQLMHAVSFSSRKSGSKSSRYVVHCELHDGTCAFLTYVPDYRKFDDDAKATLDALAWSTAHNILKADGTLKPGSELCIALKGLVMFGSVMTGEAAAGAPSTSGKDETDMERFFPTTAEDPATATGNVPVIKSLGAEEE